MDAASDEITHSLLEACSTASPAERSQLEDEIVHRHLPLARSLARRYLDRGAEFDDLVQVANFALVKAMRGFDETKGAFVPFATATILGELKRHFRDHCWSVRPPRRLQELQVDINRASAAHWQDKARAPSSAELAEMLDVDAAHVREARAANGCYHAASLDASVRVDDQTVGDLLVDPADDIGHVEDLATIARAMRTLDDTQRELIGLRFFDHLTQQEIADRTGISQMQVSRRLARLLDDLRAALTSDVA
ncbi:MAG: sigma-70 family RNA polymerase sigma factor [Aeromicrobium sp.]|uniref:sigma-70 family RNA polymerase sigma factor n=1 Tax=Aeromicrobium sp. TaxID=1871063 RepID=UPI003C450DBD